MEKEPQITPTPDAGPSADNDYSPKFSPNGRFIVFVREISEDSDIFTMNVDGRDQRRLADLSEYDYDPAVAPDAKQIVFSSSPNGFAQLFTMDVDGGDPSAFSQVLDGWATFPAWSPDGRSIAYSCGRPNFEAADLCVLSRGGRFVGVVGEETMSREWQPSWAPDGKTIAFASNETGDSEIFLVDPITREVRRLTEDPAHDSDPAWSPDGALIAFSSDRFDHDEICTMRADGSFIGCLASGIQPSWSPDGSRIVFYRATPEGDRIFVMDADGSDVQQLTWVCPPGAGSRRHLPVRCHLSSSVSLAILGMRGGAVR